MEKTNNTIFSKKVSLIYEYNRNSPLFVKMADSQIEDNNVDEAVEILKAGLKTYPEHPVAHLLLGKAFAMMGNYGKALEYFKKGSDIIQSDETYNYYVSELEKVKKQRSLFEASRGNSFFNSSKNLQKAANVPDLFNAKSEAISEKELAVSIDERLAELADQISKVKLSASTGSTTTHTDFTDILSQDNMIVSETLAKIYVAQNEYDEAIKVYEKLIKKEPSRHEHFTGKIKEIRSRFIS
ncbi:MAG: tetratricopeptide repeat protein [Bacteroidetes bacterium]|nr:tetratricopeptide repeat protein [Bacteroidota bacterium]